MEAGRPALAGCRPRCSTRPRPATVRASARVEAIVARGPDRPHDRLKQKLIVWPCFAPAPCFLSLNPSQFYLPGAAFPQQGTEVKGESSSILGCMSQWNIHLLSAGLLLPILSSMIFTARTTPCSARIISPSSAARQRTPPSVTALWIARPSISAVSLL